MKIAFILVLISVLFWSSPNLHKWCVQHQPIGVFQSVNQAVLCGKRNLNFDDKTILARAGIFHLFVTSGAHLQFLFSGLLPLSFLFNRRFIAGKLLLVASYLSACLFPAPLVRASLQWVLSLASEHHRLYWPKHTVIGATLVIGLLIHPQWIASWSFLLSIFFAMILMYNKDPIHSLKFNSKIYFLILPFFINWSPPSVFSILVNSFLTPILGVLLIPTCLMYWVIPIFRPGIDGVWILLTNHLALLPPTYFSTVSQPSLVIYWLYFFSLWYVYATAST